MNNEVILWTIVSTLIVAAVVGVLALALVKRKEIPPDYFSIFVMGGLWLILGTIMQNIGLLFLGVIFGAAGFMNRSKWKENRAGWKSLSKEEKIARAVISAILGFLVVAGILVFYTMDNSGQSAPIWGAIAN